MVATDSLSVDSATHTHHINMCIHSLPQPPSSLASVTAFAYSISSTQPGSGATVMEAAGSSSCCLLKLEWPMNSQAVAIYNCCSGMEEYGRLIKKNGEGLHDFLLGPLPNYHLSPGPY